jgi:hypothetical protein
MSEEDFPTQDEQEESARLARWPEIEEEPEIEEDLIAEVDELIKAQMIKEEGDGSS